MKIKRFFVLFFAFFSSLVFISCKKDNPTVSVKSMLQNKWHVYNQAVVIPSCPIVSRLSYTGNSSDYYYFKTNDSLYVSVAGSLFGSNTPVSSIRKYNLVNDTTLYFYNQSTIPDTLSIIKITTDSLTLIGHLSYSIFNYCTNTSNAGIANDTLRLYK